MLFQRCQPTLVWYVVYASPLQTCLQVFLLCFQCVNLLGDLGLEGLAVGIHLAHFLRVVPCQCVFVLVVPPVAFFFYRLYTFVEAFNLAFHELHVNHDRKVSLAVVVFLMQDVEHILKCVGLIELFGLGITLVELHKRAPMAAERRQTYGFSLSVLTHGTATVAPAQRTACQLIDKASTTFLVCAHGFFYQSPPFKIYA